MVFFPLTIISQKKVLFIGNSLTFYNDMPKMFEKISIEFGLNFIVDQSTFSGVSLEHHRTIYWKGNKGVDVTSLMKIKELQIKFKVDTTKPIYSTTIQKVKDGNYDFLLVQEHPGYILNSDIRKFFTIPNLLSIDSIQNNDKIILQQVYIGKKYGQKCMQILNKYSKDSMIKTYCSSVFNSYQEMNDTIISIYNTISTLTGVKIAPVSEVFEYFRLNNPKIKLYKTGNHPTKQASFIIACVYFSSITNEYNFEKLKYNPNLRKSKLIKSELTNFYKTHGYYK